MAGTDAGNKMQIFVVIMSHGRGIFSWLFHCKTAGEVLMARSSVVSSLAHRLCGLELLPELLDVLHEVRFQKVLTILQNEAGQSKMLG